MNNIMNHKINLGCFLQWTETQANFVHFLQVQLTMCQTLLDTIYILQIQR